MTTPFKSHTPPPSMIDPLVRRSTLAAELGGISLTTLWRMVREGRLPEPVRIGGGKTVGWPRSVIDAWKIEQGWPAPEQAEG